MSERVSKVAYLGEDLGATWGQLGFNLGDKLGITHLALFFFCQRCKKGPQAVSERVSNMVANPKWAGQEWLFLCYFFGSHLALLLSASIGRAPERVSKAWSAIPDGRAVVLGPPDTEPRVAEGVRAAREQIWRRRSAKLPSSEEVPSPAGGRDGMLKQKIRKSRKNLLSLLESASFYGEDSEGGKREGKGGKRGKEEERRKGLREVSPGLADEGYSTAGEKTSPSTSPGGSELGETLRTVEEGRIDKSKEVRRGEERPVRGQAVPVVGAQQATWGVPVILAVGRRSSPQEDFLWSLQVLAKTLNMCKNQPLKMQKATH